MNTQSVVLCKNRLPALAVLFEKFGLVIERVADDEPIPGSFWGDSEAGLVGNHLLVRDDTPVHSAFHESCHYICMDAQRRESLHTDAGGDVLEENAVCYLQILLADHLNDYDSETMMADMDNWGYSFRLGSSSRWFYEDAEDALDWLLEKKLIDDQRRPTWNLRT